jgi:hypothetical protein
MPSSFTTRTFTRPSLVGTMAGRTTGRRSGTERRRIISVPGRNLARGGEIESRLSRRASGSARGGARGDPNDLPRVRVGVSARREETSARGAQCRPRGLFGYLLSPGSGTDADADSFADFAAKNDSRTIVCSLSTPNLARSYPREESSSPRDGADIPLLRRAASSRGINILTTVASSLNVHRLLKWWRLANRAESPRATSKPY